MFRRLTKESLCPHCDPYPAHRAHILEKLEMWFWPLAVLFGALERRLRQRPRLHTGVNELALGGLVRVLLTLGLLKETPAHDADESLHNRSLVVVRAARRRGLEIKALKFLGRATNYYAVVINGQKNFFEGLPPLAAAGSRAVDFDDKGTLKTLLQKAGLPHPRGGVFRHYEAARRYVWRITGYPVVVKPRSGSLSKHTTCDIKNDQQLKTAIDVAKIISRDFVVEEYIQGEVYRATLVNGRVAAVCRREPPNVIGDGLKTVAQLVEIKNRDPKRGAAGQCNFTLHKIVLNPRARALLARQGANLDTILARGQKVYLHDKLTLASGADIHDVTDDIHPAHRALFEKVAGLCDAPLLGVDFIAPDTTKAPNAQKCAVLEVNSLPYIDMHHYPVTGRPRNVADLVLDAYLAARD